LEHVSFSQCAATHVSAHSSTSQVARATLVWATDGAGQTHFQSLTWSWELETSTQVWPAPVDVWVAPLHVSLAQVGHTVELLHSSRMQTAACAFASPTQPAQMHLHIQSPPVKLFGSKHSWPTFVQVSLCCSHSLISQMAAEATADERDGEAQ
jgi:hypothetical protein